MKVKFLKKVRKNFQFKWSTEENCWAILPHEMNYLKRFETASECVGFFIIKLIGISTVQIWYNRKNKIYYNAKYK